MSWLRLELRLARRDLLHLALLGTVLIVLALAWPALPRSLEAPALWFFVAVVLYGVFRWRQLEDEVAVFAAPAPADPALVETVHLGIWVGAASALALSFALFLVGTGEGFWGLAGRFFLAAALGGVISAIITRGVPRRPAAIATVGVVVLNALLLFDGPAGGPPSHAPAGTWRHWIAWGLFALLAALVLRSVRGARTRQHRPPLSPKPVLPRKGHVPTHAARSSDPLGRGATARASALRPAGTLRALMGGWFGSRAHDERDGASRWPRILYLCFELALLIGVVVVSARSLDVRAVVAEPAFWAVIGIPLALYGLFVGGKAPTGMRAIQGWPVPTRRVWWIIARGPALLFALLLVLMVAASGRGVVPVRASPGPPAALDAPPGFAAAAPRLLGRPALMPLPRDETTEPPRPLSWWPLRLDVSRRRDVGPSTDRSWTQIRPDPGWPRLHIPDERTYFRDSVSFYLRSRFGIFVDSQAIEAALGPGYDFEQVIAVGAPGPGNLEANALAEEIGSDLYPWVPIITHPPPTPGPPQRTVHYVLREDLDEQRLRWQQEKSDGRVYAFGPALRTIEAAVQPAIRTAERKHRVLGLLVLVGVFLLGIRAGLAQGQARLATLAVAVLVPSTLAHIRWQPAGVELVAWLNASRSTYLLVLGGGLVLLVLLGWELTRAWQRRVLLPLDAER